jgi:predicted  nucleic acid-binding Zn-ribbon protein
MMLDQERKNLDKLREHVSQNGNQIAKAEANIKKLEDQLKQTTYDVSFSFWLTFDFNANKIRAR